MYDKKALVKLIDEGIELLNKHRVKWSDVLVKMRNELTNLSAEDQVKDFLRKNESNIYGGMGSLYDIYICPENGNIADDFRTANKNLDKYRKRLSSEWEKLKSEK